MDTPLSRRLFLATPLAVKLRPTYSSVPLATLQEESDAVPTYRGNLARTGENPGPGPTGNLNPLWQVRIGTTITSSPAVVENSVYVGSISAGTSEGGALHAVDAATGVERWRVLASPGDGIFSSPAVGEGVVVTGTYDGSVIAADIETGIERWRFQSPSSIQLQSPAIYGGVVYVTDSGGHLTALTIADGSERWQFTSGDGVERSLSSPAVFNSILYCVDASRRTNHPSFLRAFDVVSGQERWAFIPEDGVGISGTPVIVGGNAYLITRSNSFISVDADTGAENARFDVGAFIGTPLAVVDDVAYFGTAEGELQATDILSGERRWYMQINEGSAIVSPPTVAMGTVYCGDVDGYLYAVDAVTGEGRWRSRMGILRSSPAIIGGRLYVGARNGSLRAVGGIETGSWPSG